MIHRKTNIITFFLKEFCTAIKLILLFRLWTVSVHRLNSNCQIKCTLQHQSSILNEQMIGRRNIEPSWKFNLKKVRIKQNNYWSPTEYFWMKFWGDFYNLKYEKPFVFINPNTIKEVKEKSTFFYFFLLLTKSKWISLNFLIRLSVEKF